MTRVLVDLALLERLEWSGSHDERTDDEPWRYVSDCPECGATCPCDKCRGRGVHGDSCALAAAIRSARENPHVCKCHETCSGLSETALEMMR